VDDEADEDNDEDDDDNDNEDDVGTVFTKGTTPSTSTHASILKPTTNQMGHQPQWKECRRSILLLCNVISNAQFKKKKFTRNSFKIPDARR
jgi:hypothetical protein